MPAWCSYTNMERGYAFVLGHLGSGRGGLHCGIRGALESVGFDVLSARASAYCFGSGEIGDVDHCIVE
jgi:hypothetical protein